MDVSIEKIVYPGRRLARREGRVYFTDEGLPGETVEIAPLREHKSYVEARTVRVIVPSADRRAPRCSHYQACSPLQTMDYGRQVETKAGQLAEILAPVWKSESGAIAFTPSPLAWRYRNRIRLSIIKSNRRAALAYHTAGSRDAYVPVEECHLASEAANRLLAEIARIASNRETASPKEVEVRESRATGDTLLSLFWSAQPTALDIDPFVTGIVSGNRPAGIVSFFREKGHLGEKLEWGRDAIDDTVEDTVFRIGASSFFQVNGAILPALLADMRGWGEFQGREKIADLYGGLGTFGLAFARDARDVFVVESDPANIRFLRENIGLNKAANVTICEGTSEEWMPWLAEQTPEIVIVDPPRKGLAPEVVRALAARPAAKILYLSCNPATLARDLVALKSGYRIAGIRGYDFFPHTAHIEALAVLHRRP